MTIIKSTIQGGNGSKGEIEIIEYRTFADAVKEILKLKEEIEKLKKEVKELKHGLN